MMSRLSFYAWLSDYRRKRSGFMELPGRCSSSNSNSPPTGSSVEYKENKVQIQERIRKISSKDISMDLIEKENKMRQP